MCKRSVDRNCEEDNCDGRTVVANLSFTALLVLFYEEVNTYVCMRTLPSSGDVFTTDVIWES